MDKIKIKVEGRFYEVDSHLTILEAAREIGYNIPTLCYWNKGHNSLASCRVCLVELVSSRGSRLVASCVYPISDCKADAGFEIKISSPKAIEARRTSVELLLSNHSKDCQTCVKNGQCELLHAAHLTGARDGEFLGAKSKTYYDDCAPGILRDTSKCILCGRCVERCKEAQGIGILGFEGRGFETFVAPAGNRSFASTPCIQCGQCVTVCPTGALSEKREIDLVDKAFMDGKTVIVQTAPAVRAALAEEFGHKIGEMDATGKMVAALHRLGFYRVFDTNFGADLTIMEEATELLNRIQNKGLLPQITSCSPGWINYCEYFYPELLPHLSSCKSPHEMEGAIIKSYFAKVHHLNPKDLFVVSVMPCTAKKGEAKRRELANEEGLADVDAVLTTRELALMIRRAGLIFDDLPEEEFDQDLLGEYSGAGVIFGASGGVMEAALRTAYFTLTGKEAGALEFAAVRGMEGIKEAEFAFPGSSLKVAVASGMRNAKPLLEQIKAGKSPYAFIEIMGCPGGCINGGGQPFVKPNLHPEEGKNIVEEYCQKRAKILYGIDEHKTLRQSHNNPDIKRLYEDFLGVPCSRRAEELLHTHYNSFREKYPEE